jgi:hypothetical protein
VGVEPTGEAFNSIVMDETNNRPFNPMVNAGAIATTALIRGNGFAERFGRILDMFSRYAGRALTVDDAVFQSERATGHRNRAIAYLQLNSGMIQEPVMEHLDLYFRQCAILVSARDLSMMAATLANNGVNPETGQPAISDLFVGQVIRRPIIALDVPVRRGDRVAFALALGIFPERLGDILVRQKIPPEIDWIIRVDGHTDNVPLSGGGAFADNWELSQARALSVVRLMQNELGFPPDRMAATGFGEYRPVAEGDDEAARAQNRRIELKLTER